MVSRPNSEVEDSVTISAPEGLRSLGFADLTLEKYTIQHQDIIVYCHDTDTTKSKNWTELVHLVSWSENFLEAMEANKSTMAVLELLKGSNEYPISKAKFLIEEAKDIVSSAINFETGLDIRHPDTRGQVYAVTNILVDDSNGIHDIIRQVFMCLFSKSMVRLIVKSSQYFSSIVVALIVDLMYQSGATSSEVKCLTFDKRDSLGSEMKFVKTIASSKSSKLSVISVVFKQTDTFAAAQGIIESYFREQYPNLIVMVEESAYERFVRDWQRYFSHAVHIGSRLDGRTTIVDTFNSKVQINLEAIDIKQSHKMTGYVINVLKFKTLSELSTLLGNLRKVPTMSLWNDDILLLREFCLRINQCQEFWLNHVPASLAGCRFPFDSMALYADIVAPDMTDTYNSVASEFYEELELVRKLQSQFMKKYLRLRTMLVLQAYISVLTKNKSFRNGLSVEESVARLKRFQMGSLHRMSAANARDSRIEIIGKPVGLAIVLIRSELSQKSKVVLADFIFKNLILGNGVFVVYPSGSMDSKFTSENDHIIPLRVVRDVVPDISRLSLDASIDTQESCSNRKQCPKNTYAVELSSEMTTDECDAITTSLGIRYRTIWYSDVESAKYWSCDA